MSSTRPFIVASLALGGMLIASNPTWGQNLSDRINYVMQQRARAQANNTSKSQLLGTLLYTDITVQFSETPARDVINYIQTVIGIPLIGRYSDDRTLLGIDPETPITLDATDQPALSVIEMVLAQCEIDEPCTWQLRSGYVEVGTKERLSASSAREIRYYPIRDLLMEVPRFNNAPDLDLDSALSQGGQQGGGGGSGGGGGGGFGSGGGGGGSGGGGGGSGGGGGGGGTIFGEPGDEDPRQSEEEKVNQIIDLIVETVEPDAWDINGGEFATIRYYQGTLIVRAPDYIHRQIGGYPFAVRPVAGAARASLGSRYVTFTGKMSTVEEIGTETNEITGSAGGNTTAGSGASPPSQGNATGGEKPSKP